MIKSAVAGYRMTTDISCFSQAPLADQALARRTVWGNCGADPCQDRLGWNCVRKLHRILGAAQRLIAHAKSVPILNACGKTTLPELAGVIAEARLTVTNETSAMHLAAALRVPAVAILGGGHFGRFLPYPAKCESVNQNLRIAYHSMPCYQCNWCCVYTRQPDEPGPCVTSVSVDDVWALLEPFLCSRPDVSEMEPEKTLPTARD